MVADDSGIISSNFGDTSAQNRKSMTGHVERALRAVEAWILRDLLIKLRTKGLINWMGSVRMETGVSMRVCSTKKRSRAQA